jgi:hypothetical protein
MDDAKQSASATAPVQTTTSAVMTCIPVRLCIAPPNPLVPETLKANDDRDMCADIRTDRPSVAEHRLPIPSVLTSTVALPLRRLAPCSSGLKWFSPLDVTAEMDKAIRDIDNAARGIQRMMLALNVAAHFRMEETKWMKSMFNRVSLYSAVAFFVLNRRVCVAVSAEKAAEYHLPEQVIHFACAYEELEHKVSGVPDRLRPYRSICENTKRLSPAALRAEQERELKTIAVDAVVNFVGSNHTGTKIIVPMGPFFRQYWFALSARVLLDIRHQTRAEDVDDNWQAALDTSALFANKYVPMFHKWAFTFHVLDEATRIASLKEEKFATNVMDAQKEKAHYHIVGGTPGVKVPTHKFGEKQFPRFLSSLYFKEHVQFFFRKHPNKLTAATESTESLFISAADVLRNKDNAPTSTNATIQKKLVADRNDTLVDVRRFARSTSACFQILKTDVQSQRKQPRKDSDSKHSASSEASAKTDHKKTSSSRNARTERLLQLGKKLSADGTITKDDWALSKWMFQHSMLKVSSSHRFLAVALLDSVVDWLLACPAAVPMTSKKKRKGTGVLRCERSMFCDYLDEVRLRSSVALYQPLASSLSVVWTPTCTITGDGLPSVLQYTVQLGADYRFSAMHLDLGQDGPNLGLTLGSMRPPRMALSGCTVDQYRLLQPASESDPNGPCVISDELMLKWAREFRTRVRCYVIAKRAFPTKEFKLYNDDLSSAYAIYGPARGSFALSDFERAVIDRLYAAPFDVRARLYDLCLFFSIVFYNLEDVHRAIRTGVGIELSSGVYAELFERASSDHAKSSRVQLEEHSLYAGRKVLIQTLLDEVAPAMLDYKSIAVRLNLGPMTATTKEFCTLICHVRLHSERTPAFRFSEEGVRDVRGRVCADEVSDLTTFAIETLEKSNALESLKGVVVGRVVPENVRELLTRLSAFQSILKAKMRPLYVEYVRCRRIASGMFPDHFFQDSDLMNKLASRAVSELAAESNTAAASPMSIESVTRVCRRVLENHDWKGYEAKTALVELLCSTLVDVVLDDPSLSQLSSIARSGPKESYCR